MKVRYQVIKDQKEANNKSDVKSDNNPDEKIDYSFLDRLQDDEEKANQNAPKEEKNTVTEEFIEKIVNYFKNKIHDEKLRKESIPNLRNEEKIIGLYSCKTLPEPHLCLEKYLPRFNKYFKHLTKENYIAMLIYIDRYMALDNGTKDFLNPYNVHRFILVALLTASKYLEDRHVNIRSLANIGGINLKELTILEEDFLFAIAFNLYFTPQIYKYYENMLEGILNPDQKIAFLMGLHDKAGKESSINKSIKQNPSCDLKNLTRYIFSFASQSKDKKNDEEPVKTPAPPGGLGF